MTRRANKRPVRKIDTDKLYMVDRGEAATAAFTCLDRLQNSDPEVIMAGAALFFAALCRRTMLSPHDMHELGLRLLRPSPFHRVTNDQLQSLQDFAGVAMAGDADTTIS